MISVHLRGSITKSTNTSRDTISIHTQIGDIINDMQYFDIERTDRDQSKLNTIVIDANIDTVSAELNLSMQFASNASEAMLFELLIDTHSLNTQIGAICGGIILIVLNVLIISEVKMHLYFVFCILCHVFIVFDTVFDEANLFANSLKSQIVHRTLAALFAAFVSIGTLSAFHDRPTMDEIIKWIDYETLLLIFSMMVLVAVLIDTGIFDYIAVYTFQVGTNWIANVL